MAKIIAENEFVSRQVEQIEIPQSGRFETVSFDLKFWNTLSLYSNRLNLVFQQFNILVSNEPTPYALQAQIQT